MGAPGPSELYFQCNTLSSPLKSPPQCHDDDISGGLRSDLDRLGRNWGLPLIVPLRFMCQGIIRTYGSGKAKMFQPQTLIPPPLCPSLGGGGVTWPTPKCCCWSLGPCLQGPCVVRHCHLYPLHFGGTLCIAFCEMEPDSTTICTPGTSTDVHPLHRGTRSGTRRWMLCYFIFRCNFCAPYCACTVVVATSPGELRGDRLPWMGGGGSWHVAMVYCSCLQQAAPIGRSPFAALPLDPFPL